MKRTISILLSVIMILSLMPFATTTAFADSQGIYSYTITNNEATITDCDENASGDITIPSTLGGYPVTIIGEEAFHYCVNLTSITIPDTVTSISSLSFFGCSSLTNITIPDSVISIGRSAFNGCSGLKSIIIPDSVKSIGESVFSSCSNLISISIPDSVTSIGDYSFSDCSSLLSITIPDGITIIAKSTFSRCSSLIRIAISDSITSIGDKAFYGCSSLTSITIPNSVTNIGKMAFYCSGLTSIIIPDSVTSIGESAFGSCYSLNNIINKSSCIIRQTYNSEEYILANGQAKLSKINSSIINQFVFPDKVYGNVIGTIGESAFFNCKNITSLKIPNTITTIEDMAFAGCINLAKLAIPKSVTSIGKDALLLCDNVVLYVEPDSYAENYAKTNNIQYKPMYEYVDSLVKSEKVFKDIKAGQWYVPYTDYVITYKLMKGMSESEFAPTGTLTRAMFVQILANMSGVDTTNRMVTTKFSDVPTNTWYTAAVKWANENGIVTGISETTFGPENPIERQQMCVMLVRYADLKGITLKEITQKTTFSDDANIGLYAREAVYKCQMAGIVNGMDKTSNNFAPSGNATRGQIAKIVCIFHHDYMLGK